MNPDPVDGVIDDSIMSNLRLRSRINTYASTPITVDNIPGDHGITGPKYNDTPPCVIPDLIIGDLRKGITPDIQARVCGSCYHALCDND